MPQPAGAVVAEAGVESCAELQDVLFEGSWQESNGRHRMNRVFRGHGGGRDGLETSLMRLGGA